MKPAGALVTLTVRSWDGEDPVEGDFLRTGTGWCYRIEEVVRRRDGRLGRLRCVVLGRDAVLSGEPGVWEWRWATR